MGGIPKVQGKAYPPSLSFCRAYRIAWVLSANLFFFTSQSIHFKISSSSLKLTCLFSRNCKVSNIAIVIGMCYVAAQVE